MRKPMPSGLAVHRDRMRGFTLIEMMVTIAVLAILAAIALPNFRDFMRRSAVSATTNALMADMQYARGEAVSQRGYVSLCRTTDGVTCAVAGASFDQGWLVYRADKPGLKLDEVSSALSPALLRMSRPDNGMSIRSTNTGIISFNQRGGLTGGNELRMSICAKSSDSSTDPGTSTNAVPGSLLLVSTAGRVATRKLAPDAAECAAPAGASTT